MRFKVSKFLIVIFTFLSLGIMAQSPSIALYKKAKKSYENGNYVSSINFLKQSISSLGSTNPKIEALLTQAYFNNGDIINAKVSLNKLIKITPYNIRGSENFKPYLELGKKIDATVQKEEKTFKDNIQKKRLENANKIIQQYDFKNRAKVSRIKNGSRGEKFFYNKVVQLADKKVTDKFLKTFKGFTKVNQLNTDINKRKKELGKIGAIGNKKSGYKHGIWRYYWTNGDLQKEVEYNYGRKIGKHTFHFTKDYKPTRDKNKVYFYRTLNYDENNILNLKFEERYFKTNTLKFSSYFKEDSEKVEKASLYFKDLQLSVKFYYENGNLNFESPIKNGQYNGLARRYYNNGKPWQEINYVNHKAQGKYKSFYSNGKKNQEILFKNNHPYTHIISYDRNGNKDYFSDLKNGNGIIYLRDYRVVTNNEYKKLNTYNIFRNNPKLYSIKRTYKSANLIDEYFTLKYSKSYGYKYVKYNNDRVIMFGNYRDATYKKPTLVYLNNNTITHQLTYSNSSPYSNNKVFNFLVINDNKIILDLVTERRKAREKDRQHSTLIPKTQHPNGMIKNLHSYPARSYFFSYGDRDVITIIKNNGKSTQIRPKRREYYRDYVFTESGLLHDIIIRKVKNGKELGRIYNTKNKKR